jgi:hypothetical protein
LYGQEEGNHDFSLAAQGAERHPAKNTEAEGDQQAHSVLPATLADDPALDGQEHESG